MSVPMTKQPASEQGYPPPGTIQTHTIESNTWAATPTVPLNCPRGLEYLTQVDQLLVHQKVELLEAFLGCETKNKYTIKNSMGQQVFTAKEDTDCCTRNCCGPIRPFNMEMKDNSGQLVLSFDRPLRCQSCCFPCCLQELDIYAQGNKIGSVAQEWSIFYPKFQVKNAAGDTILRIVGPCCTLRCCADVVFEVMAMSGTAIGSIRKQWSGLAREAFTDADHFGITFPMDLDVNVKATLMGALFLIDFMYFEYSN